MNHFSGPITAADARLWIGLNDYVRSTRGVIGIPKLLGARTDDEARLTWLSWVRPELETLRLHVPLEETGPARVTVDGVLSIQLGILDAVVAYGGEERISVMRGLDLGAVVLGMIGKIRWGNDWLLACRGLAPPRRMVDASDSPPAAGLRWVAQSPAGPGLLLSAATSSEGLEAGLANDIGVERISALYSQFISGNRAGSAAG